MRAIVIILTTVVLSLLAVVFVGVTELRDVNRIQQKTIDGLRERNIQESDSLKGIIKLKDDTIRIAKTTILLQADTIKNQELDKQNYKRNTHDKIHFIGFTSDAKRDSMLSKLYPSFRPLR